MAFCQTHHSQMVFIFWLLSQWQNPESHTTCECRVPSDRDQGEDIAYNQSQPLPGLDVLTPTLIWVKKENSAGWMCQPKSMASCAAAFQRYCKWQVSFTKQEGSHLRKAQVMITRSIQDKKTVYPTQLNRCCQTVPFEGELKMTLKVFMWLLLQSESVQLWI